MAIGKSLYRIDAPGKVTGATQYPADIQHDNMLHAKVVFSNQPHARMMQMDLSKAAKTDDLTLTVNYAEIHELLLEIMRTESFRLIEALAEHIASKVLDTYTIIDALTVRLTKPHPPFDIHFEGVTIELHRTRK